MAISMLKIRRPLGRLIFNMGIAIPGKTVFLIETAPRALFDAKPPYINRYIHYKSYIFPHRINCYREVVNVNTFIQENALEVTFFRNAKCYP